MRRLTSLLFVAATIVLIGSPAQASCMEPPPIEQSFAEAAAVFTGTVTHTEFDERLAHVEVSHVWKGEVPAVTEVAGSFELSPNMFTSVDRTYRLTDYVFFVRGGPERFEDDACTLTQPAADLDEAVLAMLSAGGDYVPTVLPEPPPAESSPATTVLLGLAGFTAIAAAVVGVRHVRNRSPRPEVQGFSLDRD